MDRKLRLKLIQKMAQTATTTAPANTTTNSMNTIVAPPPQLDVWAAYPEPMKSYSPYQVTILNNLTTRLSNAINQLTAGKFNFQKLKASGFQYDPSSVPDINSRNLLIFFTKVFKTLLNSGNAFPNKPINPQDLSTMINALSQSTELNALGQINPTGPVANQQAGNNNLLETIRNTLRALLPNIAAKPI